MMDDAPILTVDGLHVRLPKGADRPYAVENVSFTLNRREILCVVGESGSGKSVLASSIMGAPPRGLGVASGRIALKDRDLTGLSERALSRIRGNRIAMIFQEPSQALNPAIRVGRQIEEVFALHVRMSAEERRMRALALIESMHLPDPARIYRSYPHQMSGGQCQRVIIAMALAMGPEVLIADEPTTALDVTTQAQVLKLVRELRDSRGHGILFITHDFGVVAEIADRIAVMQKGRLVEIGEARQILTAPAHPYTRALIAAVPGLSPAPRPAQPIEPASRVLLVEGLCKSYGATQALQAAGLELVRGQTLAVVGESGSGKTTLARLVVRLVEPTGGAVTVGGAPFLALKGGALRKRRRSIQMIFQDPFGSLNPRRRVGEVIARAAILAGADAAAARQKAQELLELVGLSREAYFRRPAAFSGGQRQRIGIARALAMGPDILIADESVSALDVSVQAQVLALLQDLQARLGLAILFITHDLRVAAQIADRVVVMKSGQIVESGDAATVLTNPAHPYTKALLAAAPGRGMV
jgi:peptide/nickel transport system ATP-binding protein